MQQRISQHLTSVGAVSGRHRLDRLIDPAPAAALGIITTGKASLDTLDALDMVRQASAASILPEIRHYKIGLSWPVDENGLNEFVGGLDHVLVIERSEEHTSELQSLMRNSSAVFCLKQKTHQTQKIKHNYI